MKATQTGSRLLFIGLVLASLIFANLIAVRHFISIDLTKDAKYTLSESSKQTLRKLKDTMVVTAYFSEGLPVPYASYARYVRDMLEAYRAQSRGRLGFEFIDPNSDPHLVDGGWMSVGLQPVEIRIIADDQQQSKRAFMGLVVQYQGKKEVMPLVQNFADFERDLTSKMRKVMREREPVLGLLSDMQGASIETFKSLIRGQAKLRLVSMGQAALPADLDALMVVGCGQGMSDTLLAAIDAFVRSGKSAAFFVDRYRFDAETLQKMPGKDDNAGFALRQWLQRQGVTLGDEMVLDGQSAQLAVDEHLMNYPLMPQVLRLDQESPLTRGLSGVVLPFVSPLKVEEGTKWVVLARSSPKSWLESMPVDTNLKRDFKAPSQKDSGAYALMVGKDHLWVTGSSAFLWDPFIRDQNQALAMATVDTLLADDVSLSMRSRSYAELPIDPALSDDQRVLVKVANIFGGPLLLIAYGLWRWRRRENRRHNMSFDSIR